MPEKYLRVDGIATYVHHFGSTTLPDQPPDLSRGEAVVCLHGAGGNGSYLRDLMGPLAAAHSPVAFDQPAHGRSGGLDSLGAIDRMAGFARGVVKALGLRSPVLLGHSMGGAVAQRVALDELGSVRALILVSTGARLPVPEELLSQVRRVTEGKEPRAFTRHAYSPATPDEIVRRGWMEDAKTDPRAAYGDLLACREWDALERIEEISVPTLVAVGEDERPELREQSEILAARIEGARSIVIPGAGHALPLERPRELAEAILSFLEEALA